MAAMVYRSLQGAVSMLSRPGIGTRRRVPHNYNGNCPITGISRAGRRGDDPYGHVKATGIVRNVRYPGLPKCMKGVEL